ATYHPSAETARLVTVSPWRFSNRGDRGHAPGVGSYTLIPPVRNPTMTRLDFGRDTAQGTPFDFPSTWCLPVLTSQTPYRSRLAEKAHLPSSDRATQRKSCRCSGDSPTDAPEFTSYTRARLTPDRSLTPTITRCPSRDTAPTWAFVPVSKFWTVSPDSTRLSSVGRPPPARNRRPSGASDTHLYRSGLPVPVCSFPLAAPHRRTVTYVPSVAAAETCPSSAENPTATICPPAPPRGTSRASFGLSADFGRGIRILSAGRRGFDVSETKRSGGSYAGRSPARATRTKTRNPPRPSRAAHRLAHRTREDRAVSHLSRAAANAVMAGNRSAGFLARAVRTMASSRGSRPGRTADAGGGSFVSTW